MLRRLEPARLKLPHARLAEALEDSGRDDPEAMAVHLAGAGQTVRASEYAAHAAGRAARILAFDRAARLYQQALELQPAGEGAAQLRVKRARTLANAGRCHDAATEYIRAAETVRDGSGLELHFRAAEQLLLGGHTSEGLALLSRDDATAARDEVSIALDRSTRKGFDFEHFAIYSQVVIHLYAGEDLEAWELLSRRWAVFEKAILPFSRANRIGALEVHGRCALAAIGAGLEPGPLLKSLDRDTRRISRERGRWIEALVELLRGGRAAVLGKRAEAMRWLEAAVTGFNGCGMALYKAVALRRLGEVTEGDRGQEQVREANRLLSGLEVVRPDRMVACFAPGHRRQVEPDQKTGSRIAV